MDMLLPVLFSQTSSIITTQYTYILLSILISVGITGLFYLLSYVLNHPPLTALAKEELAALIMTIFIIGGWAFFQAFLWQITCALAFGSCDFVGGPIIPANHIGIAYASLEILFLKLRAIYTSLYLYEVLIGFLSTVYVPMGTFNPAVAILPISMPPLAGLTLLSNAHTILVEAIGMVMVAIIAKQHLLNFAMYAVPLVLLPMGLVLRSFPLYRTTGSSIISMCIAIYFVYPLSVLLSNYMIIDLYKPADVSYAPTAVGFCQSTASGMTNEEALSEKAKEIYDFRKDWSEETLSVILKKEGGFWQTIKDIGGWIVSGVASLFKAAYHILTFMLKMFGEFSFSIMSLVWGGAGHYGVIAGLFYFVIEEVAIVSQFVIVVIATSVFEIIMTVTMYRNISLLIGGEIDIAGLSKIV